MMFEHGTGSVTPRHREFFAQAGDARQVWARDGRSGDVFFLPEGGVTDEIRVACRTSHLVCPLPDCPDGRFVAHGGAERRHHFAHRVAHASHTSAEIFRREAAEMLGDWVAHRYPRAKVSLTESGALTEVAIRSHRTGRIVTLAVTYDRRWDPPREELRTLDRQVLLGHTRGLLLPREQDADATHVWWCGRPRLASRLMLTKGAALAVNPRERLVATLVPTHWARNTGLLNNCRDSGFPVVCLVDELDACELTARGLMTPALKLLPTFEAARSAAFQPAPRLHRPLPETPTVPDRQAEYLRRAEGKTPSERMALLREIFLSP